MGPIVQPGSYRPRHPEHPQTPIPGAIGDVFRSSRIPGYLLSADAPPAMGNLDMAESANPFLALLRSLGLPLEGETAIQGQP
jgi:hypothetical protein